MAEQEKKVILTVDTGESQRTVKSLKQEISDLKDAILNLEKGSDEYNDAVEQLTVAQRELNEVQALTKKTAVALDGSYDALVHRMSLLKKEWRATADEAHRAELGSEIAQINQQLKNMDAELGNYQRNVGNYVSHWEGMPEIVEEGAKGIKELRAEIKQYQAQVMNAEEGTQEWVEAMNNLANAQFQMRDMNEKSRYAVADLGEQLTNLTGIASGVMSGFSAVQGAMVLCGVETENFEKTMLKLQSAMAIVQGLQGLEGLQDRVTGLVSSIKVATKAMGKGGWIGIIIAVVTAITALIAHLTIKNKKIKDGTKALEDYNKASNATIGNYADEIAKIKILESASTDVNRAYEDRIKASKELLKILGEEVTETNAMALANGDYATSIDKVTEKLIQQARMEGALELIKEKQKEILEQQVNVNERMSESPTVWDNMLAGIANSSTSTTGVHMQPSVTVDAEDMKEAGVERQKKKLEQMQNDFNTYISNLFKDFNIDDIILGLGGEKEDDTDKKINEKVMTMAEALALASQQIQETLEDDILNLDFKIDIEDEDFLKTLDEKNKKLKESAQFQIQLAERTANREKTVLETKKNQEIAYAYQTITNKEALEQELKRIDEDYAQQEYEIEMSAKEKKLQILYEWRDKNTDARIGVLEIAQEIADAEVDIEKDKIERINELHQEELEDDEEYADEKAKIWGNIVNSINAAADVTQGILEITQAAYEKDGEITEKEAKKIKGMQIAIATMNMLAGITAALSGAFTTKTGPWDIALAAVQAATIAASGTANIMKIKNTDLTGSVTSGAQLAVTPNSNIYGTDLPMSYVRNITTASEVDELNKTQKVYILESDIQASNKKVSIRESESSF